MESLPTVTNNTTFEQIASLIGQDVPTNGGGPSIEGIGAITYSYACQRALSTLKQLSFNCLCSVTSTCIMMQRPTKWCLNQS